MQAASAAWSGVNTAVNAPRHAASAAWSTLRRCAVGDDSCDADDGVPPFYTVIAKEEGPNRFWKACEGDTEPYLSHSPLHLAAAVRRRLLKRHLSTECKVSESRVCFLHVLATSTVNQAQTNAQLTDPNLLVHVLMTC